MRYYKKIYIGDNVSKDTLELLKQTKPQATFGVYVICVSKDTVGMFEIMSTNELLRPHNIKRDYAVVAVLRGLGSAKLAVVDIICSWLKAHKDLNGIKEYYNNNSL